ncbi:BOLA class I histocompatibility antigen, alpha chain BL3-7-like [Denticeps clupeoides]|uniref:BOLA class I histocompatibility antigen, alpha chain BL3-7-like n=1 Tax=Denticeps clupeoides TaxID=299321 RepID=UPI0010A433DF|nr:BOLA class I histocompatibility antigen, alpha chain BL3-7-like [Denticeps clupeoides]
MKILAAVILLLVDPASGVIHSWTGLYTAATGIKDLPEFVGVNLFDDEVTGYFDSKNNQFEIRQDWVKELGEKYVEDQTKRFRDFTWKFKENLKMIMTEFNQTGDQGVHTLQLMYGCQWEDEDGATDGYSQYGYNGEDFIRLDLKNFNWVAARTEAEIIKQKWNGGEAKFWKNYLEHDCIEWIKKYARSGKISLERKVPPQVSLLQTDPSSPVVCHATGFYPDKVKISWQKDGQDLHEDVDVGETLSNHDGTFQKRAELKVTPDVWKKNQFTCVVEHKSGDPIHMILTEEKIRTNSPGNNVPGIVAGLVVAALVLIAVVVGVVMVVKRRSGYQQASHSDQNVQQGSGVSHSQPGEGCELQDRPELEPPACTSANRTQRTEEGASTDTTTTPGCSQKRVRSHS